MKKSQGKHKKYVPLNQTDIEKERILLKGRMLCTCEASRHKLINNCVHCGRIVCEQEGSGPCFTCGELVCTDQEKNIIVTESKKATKLYIQLMNLGSKDKEASSNEQTLESAVEHRDRLLNFDQHSEKRTKVIDDEMDYFQSNSQWLSKGQRELLQKKEAEVYDQMHSRKVQKLTFDFDNKMIIEEKQKIDYNISEEELLRDDTSIFKCDDMSIVDIPDGYFPEYIDENRRPYSNFHEQRSDDKRNLIRIQDKELQQMSDDGNCLSLHQPEASLLVAGIKKHEGRTWYTSYRGRLWIHAAAKIPSQQSKSNLENHYRALLGNKVIFPKSYPPSCLLGCVDVVDCLPLEEYNQQYPGGESSSPYIFICENAQELVVKFPMKGQHKIFKLESNIHQAAKKTLRKLN